MFSESYDQQLSDVSILYLDLLSFAILLFYYKLIQTEKDFFSDVFCQVLQAKVTHNNNNGNNNNNNNIRFYKPKLHTIRPDPYAEKPGRGM